MRVARCLSRPRMKTETTRCGACSLPPGPGTRPGLMVLKRNAPRASVGMRPKPLKPLQRLFLFVIRMRVPAVGVRLPDLHHAVVDPGVVAVEQSPLDRHPLALDLRAGQIARDEPGEADVKVRADGLVAARVEFPHRFIAPSASPRVRAGR